MWVAVRKGESQSSGAGGAWSEILSGLKTLLETGRQLHSKVARHKSTTGSSA